MTLSLLVKLGSPGKLGVDIVVATSSIRTLYNPSLSGARLVSLVKPSYFGISSKLEKAFVSAVTSDFTTSSFCLFNSISLNFSQLALSLSISGRASYSLADMLGCQSKVSISGFISKEGSCETTSGCFSSS